MSETTDQPAAEPFTPSRVQSDRFCRNCAANLLGAPVEREAHYRLLIARCPQCGGVEPLQEFPHVGPWAARWLMLLGALWLGSLLIFALGTSIGLFGGLFAIAEESGWALRYEIQSQFQLWLAAKHPDLQQPMYWQFTDEFPEFWAQQDVGTLIDNAGGLAAILPPEALPITFIPLIGAFLLGVFWSVILLHASRRGRALFCAGQFLLVATGGFVLMWLAESTVDPQPWSVVFPILIAPLLAVLIVLTTGALVLGSVVGRGLVRRLLQILLPPRLRSAFDALWTADDLSVK